jgi:hypothetical protein
MNTAHSSHPQPSFMFPSHLALDPSLVPLPATPDADLLHAPTVASATGHTPSHKVAGSRHKVIPSDPKGKGKRMLEVLDLDSSDSGGESEPPKAKNSHGGCQAGAGNYQDNDLKELLCLVEEELPIGGNGWKHVSVHFAQWASHHSRSTHDTKGLETKFKMVC